MNSEIIIEDKPKNVSGSFYIDSDTAENFRKAVKHRWRDNSWGKMKDEVKKALDNHAKKLNNHFELTDLFGK